MAPPEGEPGRVELGAVTAPSGSLVLVDGGMLGDPWERVAGFAVVVAGLPRGRPLPVVADRDPDDADRWRRVVIEVLPGAPAASSEPRGEIVVDFARILVIDADARKAWRHEESIDGLADVAFWGLEAPALAEAAGAGRIEGVTEVFGWRDLPLDVARDRAASLEGRREALGLRVPIDFRPHSDHWRALEIVRAFPENAGCVEVGGARACLFFTMVGDGRFPVVLDRDPAGRIARIRIEMTA